MFAQDVFDVSGLRGRVGAYVVVQLAESGARSGRGGNAALSTGRVKRTLAEHEGVLLPSVDARGDESTATIAVPDMTRATALADALRDLEEVESAYAKPGEELP